MGVVDKEVYRERLCDRVFAARCWAAVATPFAVLIGDHDEVTPLDQVEEWKSILQTKAEVRVGRESLCQHGWSPHVT